MAQDLHELPHLEDSLTYLYIEKAIIEKMDDSITIVRGNDLIPVPISALTVLMLGPGTSVTQAAMRVISENGCLVIWCGEGVLRFYGYGMGETRSSANLLRQASFCMDEEKHLLVARRMYQLRFRGLDVSQKTLQQLRGIEGVRVRELYKMLAAKYGLSWKGRSYNADEWDASDDLNKALSAGNTCLYGLCNAAIVSLGFSPGLGFIHTGKMLSFVYDIADLYKAETTVPLAFDIVASHRTDTIERTVRKRLRSVLRERRILKRIPKDIEVLFEQSGDDDIQQKNPGVIWNGGTQTVPGGVNYAEDEDGSGNSRERY